MGQTHKTTSENKWRQKPTVSEPKNCACTHHKEYSQGWTNGAFPLHGTARYGSLLGGFPLGTVPGTWYFFSTTSAEVPSDLYRYQNVTCKLCCSLIGRRKSSLLHHWTCDTRPSSLQPDPLDLNQHSQRRIGRNFCLNKRTFLHQPQITCFIVCWGSSDVPLVDSRGADPVRAWWRDAKGKCLLCIYFWTCYIFRVCLLFIFLRLYLCFASIKNNLIE